MKWKNRRTVIIVFLFVVLVFASCAAETNDSALEWLFHLYGYELSTAVQQSIRTNDETNKIDYGEFIFQVDEVLYDGRWLFTSAKVTPKDDSQILIMPYDADINDYVSGGYNENLRDDDRTFLEAAIEDNLSLLVISICPIESRSGEWYYLDHRQDDNGVCTLYSGAPVSDVEDALIHMQIQIWLIDPNNNEMLEERSDVVPVVIHPLNVISQRIYLPSEEGDKFPIQSISMIQTELTTYFSLEWPQGIEDTQYSLYFLDENGNRIQQGIPDDIKSLTLYELPSKFSVVFEYQESRLQGFFVQKEE